MSGSFAIAAGSCATAASPNGSWIQLALQGSPIKNPDSSCDGGAYTLLSQGTRGLVIGGFEGNPSPTFDSSGNSLADAIIAPTEFLGTRFGAATDPQNEQTAPSGPAVFPAPQAVLTGTRIHANLSAVNFTYNGPSNGTCASGGGDGCYAVGSADVQGTYDAVTRAYTLQWTGTIHGGAFNNATAVFHLTGVFNGTISTSTAQLSSAGSGPTAVVAGSGSASTVGAGGSQPVPAALTGHSAPAAAPQANEMVGTFTISAGSCGPAGPAGSWLQLSKGGSPIPNPLSPCQNGNYTTLSQGTQGLLTGQFQPDPTPTFDGNGNSLASAIIKPTPFLGAAFGAATDAQNEQTAPSGPAVFPVPYAVLDASGTSFVANLAAMNFTYNGTPNGTCASGNGVGCYSVGSSSVQGSYSPGTHAYTMQWTGQVVGGAFNGATATFHLTGSFEGTITKVAASNVAAGSGQGAPGLQTSAVPGATAPAGGAAPAYQAPKLAVEAATSLPGSGPIVIAEEAVTVALGLGLIAFGLGFGRRLRLGRRPPAA